MFKQLSIKNSITSLPRMLSCICILPRKIGAPRTVFSIIKEVSRNVAY